MSFGGGPCMEGADCSGSIELDAHGTLRYDATGDPGGGVRETVIPSEDLPAALAVAADAELVALLTGGPLDCPDVADFSQDMSITIDGVEHTQTVTGCDHEPIVAARDLLYELASTYFE